MATSKRYGVRLKYSRDLELINFLDSLSTTGDCSEWIRDAIRTAYELQKRGKKKYDFETTTPVPAVRKEISVAAEVPDMPEDVEEVPSVEEVNAKLDSFGSNF